MKTMKKSLLLASLLGAAACVAGTPGIALADNVVESNVAGEATFQKVENVGGIEGSSFYIYVASEAYSPRPMLTSVIYVYADQPCETEEDAYAVLENAGLIGIAEDEYGAVILVNPVGGTWGKEDVDVFEAIESYIFFVDGELPLTYHNLQYAIGEGSGATFINDYLSKNCKRLAGVMTFGGEIHDMMPDLALPAYIVSGSQEAVDYYLTNNDGSAFIPNGGRLEDVTALTKSYWETADEEDSVVYTFTQNPVKQVIVSKKEADALDAELIADCWDRMFRCTTRTCLTTNCWMYSKELYNDHEFTLAARPDYEAAGMEVVKVDGIGNGIFEDDENSYWYELIPAAVQEAMENGSDEKFPLIMCFHGGGDHPIFEAESVGWAQAAIDHDLIVVAPNVSTRVAGDDNALMMLDLIDHICETYPVDTSRIYAVGFSGGSRSTLSVSNTKPELFAAAGPMSCVSGPFYTPLQERIAAGEYAYDIDLPIIFSGQAYEIESTNNNYEYIWDDAVQIMRDINEIPQYEGELDYSKYPYWGFPVEDEVRQAKKTGFAIWRACMSDENGIPLLACMHSEGLTHAHYPEYAETAWEWMSQFSRDTETFDVIYTPAE